jgi:hypothetical protein
LAEGDEVCHTNLRSDAEFPARGNLRPHESTEAGGCKRPSNIADGHGRTARNEFHQFIGYARASLRETETQMEIAFNLGYIDQVILSGLLEQSSEIGRMLTGLRSWAAGANS